MAITPPQNIKDVLVMTVPLTPTLSRRERENKDAATFTLTRTRSQLCLS
jgi:hypothetical protein